MHGNDTRTVREHDFICIGAHEEWAPWTLVNQRGDRISVRLWMSCQFHDLDPRVSMEGPRHVVVELSYPGFYNEIGRLVAEYGSIYGEDEAIPRTVERLLRMVVELALPALGTSAIA